MGERQNSEHCTRISIDEPLTLWCSANVNLGVFMDTEDSCTRLALWMRTEDGHAFAGKLRALADEVDAACTQAIADKPNGGSVRT